MLKTRDYDLWSMRMEQYLTHTDYALWEVIINGNSLVPEPPAVGPVVPPKTKAQKFARKNELKAKSYQYGLESLEDRIHVHLKNETVFEESIAFLKYDVQVRDISIKDLKNQLEETMKEKDDLKEKITKFEESSKNLTKLINSQMSTNDKTGLGYDSQLSENKMPKCEIFETASDSSVSEIDEYNNQAKDRYKVGIGYYAVPPSYTGNYMPPRADLSFAGLDDSVFKFKISKSRTSVHENESIASKSSEEIREEPKTVRSSAPTIEDWESDSEDECEDKTSIEQEISSNDNSVKSVKSIATKSGQVLVNAAKQNSAASTSTTRPKGNPQYTLQDQGIFDSGCSRHMTGNKSFLTEYQKIDGGYVAFGCSPKGDKITCKGKIRSGKLDFEDVYFVKELMFNLFSVSQMYDNETEFKNSEMNQFCQMKGIKREFSVARTPQQNRAEAVNSACYVQNRVLVIKPHNKTPYELLIGRSPNLKFMRPFGCLVTIFNTLDHLGKFDGKADEGFLVRYSVNSKAFRVFNSRIRKVKENLHVNFLENKPNVVGSGPKWLFDIDSLTKSMNYEPVSAGNQSNGDAAKVKKVNDQEQIQALVDKTKVIITDDSIRSDLRLDDAKGTACLINEAIFEGLACMGLQEHVLDLQEAKDAQVKEIAALKKKVTKLTKWRKLRSRGLRRLKMIGSCIRVKSSMEKDGLGAQEDASKHRRMIKEIDQNAKIALDDETQERTNDNEMFRVDDLDGEEVVMETTTGVKDSVAPTTDVTEDKITMAQALAALKSIKPKVVVQEQEMSTTIPAAATIVTTVVPTPRAKGIVFLKQKQSQIPTVSSSKDKGKAKMIKPEVTLKKKEQMRIDEEYARKLQAEEQEAARLSRAQQDEEANNSWDNIQVMMDADRLLAERLQAREREEFSKVQKARLLIELIKKRTKHFAALRAQEKRNKPPTKTQMKSQIEMGKVKDFVAMDLEAQKSSAKEAQESSTKRTTEHLESAFPRNKRDEVLIEATPISSRSLTIIDYKTHKEGKKTYFKIIRADGNSQVYQTFEKMFKNFNREDLEVLWAIVKDGFKKEKPVDDIDNILFRTLKTMFKHHVEEYSLLLAG
nr:hypothetical protein [Tanacetum cinerariifolium]